MLSSKYVEYRSGIENCCFKTVSLTDENFILTIREGWPHGGKASLVEGYTFRISVGIFVLRKNLTISAQYTFIWEGLLIVKQVALVEELHVV